MYAFCIYKYMMKVYMIEEYIFEGKVTGQLMNVATMPQR